MLGPCVARSKSRGRSSKSSGIKSSNCALLLWPGRRQLKQAPPPPPPLPAPVGEQPALLDALLGIQGDLVVGTPSASAPPTDGSTAGSTVVPAAPTAAGSSARPGPDGGSSPTGAGPGPCTDPSLLTQTMTTFCKLLSLEQLAGLDQAAVQACCRLTSATLQRGCWDACTPPPAVSQDVLGVLKLWRTICLISASVTCEEAQPQQTQPAALTG